ncbi:MAG TPA: preprotein translocase subunit SecE [Thermoanaerobaculia bacterium]|jgi:preprotein translocase subunit SecE|nr:preprotein translocase subunit SecE [Thermoanaerobaculia bacterium]
METKETTAVSKPTQWMNSTKEFFRDTASEMKKVTWPTKNEVVGTTTVVIVATIVFALFLWGCDVVFYKAIDFLFTRFGASA